MSRRTWLLILTISSCFLLGLTQHAVTAGQAAGGASPPLQAARQSLRAGTAGGSAHSDKAQAPSLTVTKAGSLKTDVNGNGLYDPGDTIHYTVTISNSSGADVTGAAFSDALDNNVTFAPGSLNTSPIALDDSYPVLGNVPISITAPGLLANDFEPDGNPLTVTSVNTAGTQGSVTFAADGSFTFNPTAGFTGTTTFTYTISDGQTPAKTDTATVTLTVSGLIWFINDNAGACASSCDGRLTNPFTTLAAFNAVNVGGGNNPDNGDSIFVYGGGGTYTGGLTLRPSQILIGQGASQSISTISGLNPPPGSSALPATGGASPHFVNAGGDALTLANAVLVQGLDITAASGAGVKGGNTVNSATVKEMAISGTTTAGVDLNGGTGTIAFGGTVTTTGGHSVQVQNRTGGTTTFSEAISDTGSGINLVSNTGATIAFTGGLSASTGANTAFNATGGGMVTAAQNNTTIVNTLTTTTGTALNVTSTTIG